MARFDVPRPIRKSIFTISNFLGIDLSSNDVDPRRSDNCYNIIDTNGLHEKRHGFKNLGLFTPDSDPVFTWKTNILLDIFRYDNEAVMEVKIQGVLGDRHLILTKQDNFSDLGSGSGTIVYEEIITEYSINYLKKVKFGNKWYIYVLGGNTTDDIIVHTIISFTDENDVEELVGFIPTTIISRNPDGTAGTSNQDVNLLQVYRKNGFLGTAGELNYTVEDGTMTADIVTAEILQGDGSFVTITEGSGLTVNRTTNTISFTVAPGITPIDGQDNSIIQFGIELASDFSQLPINNLIVFGYENNDRLFINARDSNIDYYSAANDATYFPSKNFSVMGSDSKITGYAIVNNRLLTFKDDLNSIWSRDGALIDNTEVFPSDKVSSYEKIVDVVQNDERVIALTYTGIFEIYVSGKVYFQKRSFYVDSIFKDLDPTNFSMEIFNDKLYLKDGKFDINGIPDSDTYDYYIIDMNITSSQPYENDTQWEWYPQNGISRGNLFVDYEYLNGEKEYFIFLIDNFYVNRQYNEYSSDNFGNNFDEIPTFVYDSDTFTWTSSITINRYESYWETPFLNMGTISFAKTIRNIYLNTKNTFGDSFEVGYILPDGTTTIINEIEETNNGGFPQLLNEKEKIKKYMWIKFYIKSTFNQEYDDQLIYPTNYYKLISDNTDSMGNVDATITDLTYDLNGALFNGITSKLELQTADADYGREFITASIINDKIFTIGFEFDCDRTVDQILFSRLTIVGGNYYGFYTEIVNITGTSYLRFYVADGTPTMIERSEIILTQDNNVVLYTSDLIGFYTYLNGSFADAPPLVSIDYGWGTAGVYYPVFGQDVASLGKTPFTGYLKNLYIYYNDLYSDSTDSLFIYNNIDDLDTNPVGEIITVEENGRNMTFDTLQLEWQRAGKYRGD